MAMQMAMYPIFSHLQRCVSGLCREGKKKWHSGKWKRSPIIQKDEFSLNLKVPQVILVSIIGGWALLSKWKCKLFEKVNSSHANAFKEEEWRKSPWRFLPTWPGSLPGLGSSPITQKRIIRKLNLAWRQHMQILPYSRYNYFSLWKNVNSTVLSFKKFNTILTLLVSG